MTKQHQRPQGNKEQRPQPHVEEGGRAAKGAAAEIPPRANLAVSQPSGGHAPPGTPEGAAPTAPVIPEGSDD